MKMFIHGVLFYNDQTTKDTPESVEVACHKLIDTLLASTNVDMKKLVAIDFFTPIVAWHPDDLLMKVLLWKRFEPKLLRSTRDAQGHLLGSPIMYDAIVNSDLTYRKEIFEELVKCPELRDEVKF